MASLSTSFALQLMRAGASAANLTWPLNGRIFRERLEIDPNCSLWASKTPGYRPRPALKGAIHADLAIIGGGFTGVSTAYYVSKRFPNRRIVLLEAAALANGASGRNGGMMLNWVNGFEDAPPELAARIYRTTSAGIEALCRLIEEHHLSVDYRRDGTVAIYTSPARAEAAHAEVEAQNALGIPTRFLNSSELRAYLRIEHGCGAVLDPGTGQINGAQLVRGLAPVLEARGVQIYEGTPVIRIEEGRRITLTTLEGSVRADAIVLATNGYTGALGYFRDALFPLHSHVFATAALPVDAREQLGWRGLAGFSDDLDRISYASMTCDGHLVFGGGGNHAYSYLFNNRTVFPGGAAAARRAHAAMERTLQRYFPSTQTLPITHRWVGTLGVTFDRRPLIGVRGEHRNVYYALGYSGHGVTLANLAGEILCDLYSGDDSRWRELPFVQRSYPRIPPEPFRWIGYHIFTRLTGKSPRV
ncbi:MAG: FAD-binding oxidoreductase [Caldilinea sp.]|uniref:NAD(P)/FAD-dependent oxidoreductase n=1 Tax=Caldilinea sp. TaxID=2293560 RepID=UPI00309E29FC